MMFFTRIQAKVIYFFPYCQAGTFIRGGMFIHFSLSSQGVRLFGRVHLFGSLEYIQTTMGDATLENIVIS